MPEVVGWLESKAKIRVLRGGNRSSKTQTAAFEFARWARGLQISKKYQKLPRPRRGKLELLCVAIDYNKIGEVNYAKLFLPGQYFKYRFKCPQCGELVFASAERCAEAEWMTMIRNNAKTRFAAYDGMVHCWTCGFMMKLAEVPPEWRWEAPPLIPEREIVKMSWADKAKNIPAFVETTTARISFLSGQSGREHFQGNRWHMVWIDEELGDDSGGVWSEIIRGTMDLSGRILWSATPLARQDALIDIHDKAVAKDPDIYEAVVGLVHNHHIALKERASVARSWPREQWMCRIKGEFFALEGLVYPEFQRDIHCVPRWNIAEPSNAKDFTWYRSIDPGLGVTACLWFGVDRYGDYVVTDELHMESGNIKTMVDLIREIDAGRYICDTTIDPSDQRSLTCREGLRVVLARDYGMPCHSNFSRDVNQGIFRCKEDLIVNSERKRPRMTVFEDCDNFIRGLTRYRRGDEKSTADNSNKVVKRDDHELDAWRYRRMSGLEYRGGIASEGIYYPTAAMKVWAEEELPRIRSERKAQEAML